MGRQQSSTQQVSRPKRRATNAHIFRYLQTRNPSKLEENDLKRALEASLEECPDFWPEETASCNSSEQSNGTSVSSPSSLLSGNSNSGGLSRRMTGSSSKRSRTKSSMQPNHLNNCSPNHHNNHSHINSLYASSNNCPFATVHKRYRPVAKKNIYNEADFFHDGIMEYIEYELLSLAASKAT